MIEQILIRGFKDCFQKLNLSGLDLITSRDKNGVGKSAVLEAFQLGLLGEIPGRVKTLRDIMQYTSQPEMAVEIKTRGSAGTIRFKRSFVQDAPWGDKRPVAIQGTAMKYEEGHQWILDEVGAVTLAFDPIQFLRWSDERKMRWILRHCPEIIEMTPEAVQIHLLIESAKRVAGAGSVHSLLREEGIPGDSEFLLTGGDFPFSSLKSRLISLLRDQDETLCNEILDALDTCSGWTNPGSSAADHLDRLSGAIKLELHQLSEAIKARELLLSRNNQRGWQLECRIEEAKKERQVIHRELARAERMLEALRLYEAESEQAALQGEKLRSQLFSLCRALSDIRVDGIEKKHRELAEHLCPEGVVETFIDDIRHLERDAARAQGKFIACWEELSSLEMRRERLSIERRAIGNREQIEDRVADLRREEKALTDTLLALASLEGEARAADKAAGEITRLKRRQKCLKWMRDAVGPKGLLGQIAKRIAPRLEREVNDLIKRMQPETEFILDITPDGLDMRWKESGKAVPFLTLGSGRFTLFGAVFMTALLRRMAESRKRRGKPTHRALCIEGGALSPDNLLKLMQGVSILRALGHLDNVLIAHYHSFEDASLLSGFREHVLVEEEQRDRLPVLQSAA